MRRIKLDTPDLSDINFEELHDTYLPTSENLTCDDTIFLLYNKIKHLPEPERRILLLYAEYGSYAKIARIFKCSSTLIYYKLKKIRQKLK